MSFFDDKQEILKVELTTYGRFLLSKGKFKPSYYAYFDDDILYDAEYANLQENQNLIQTRILDETISLKPQTTFSSVEKNIKINSLVSSEASKMKMEESQITSDKNYSLSLPLGNSSLSSDYYPSWSIMFSNGNIESINNFIDNSDGLEDTLQPYLKIPQINLKDIEYEILKTVNSVPDDPLYQVATVVGGLDNQIFYSIKDAPLIIDIKELNTDNLIKNFDVEIFMEEEELIPGKNEKKKILKKLNFVKQSEYIVDNILLDEPRTYNDTMDESYSEYFFESTVDDEIELPPETKEKFIKRSTSSAQGAFGTNC